MGKMLVTLAQKDERFSITAALEKEANLFLGSDAGLTAGISQIGINITKEASDFDVIIDFSDPYGTLTALDLALDKGSALVVGTTGLDDSTIEILKTVSEEIGIFIASNFSRGIALCKEISARTATGLPNADIELVEAHHRNKIDAPSGTALDLARGLAATRKLDFDEQVIYGRKGRTGPREADEIAINTIRGGGIVGEHRIIFASPFETVVIEHRAISRALFAAGALDAAEFVYGKKGFFDMNDLINN